MTIKIGELHRYTHASCPEYAMRMPVVYEKRGWSMGKALSSGEQAEKAQIFGGIRKSSYFCRR